MRIHMCIYLDIFCSLIYTFSLLIARTMDSSQDSTLSPSSQSSTYSALQPSSSSPSCSSSYQFLGVLSQECPNYMQCEGEIEVWRNLKKNEVFVQCSGDCRNSRFLTKIATYATCCVCGYGIVSVSTPVLVLIYLTMLYSRAI